MTEDEIRRINRRMEQVGVKNRSAFIRKMVLDGYIVNLDLTDVKELIRLLRICSNNLNQYAKVANGTGYIGAGDIEDLRRRLDDIWKATKRMLRQLAAIM